MKEFDDIKFESIDDTESATRVWLDDNYALHKFKNLSLWYLEYYNFGKNYMPIELYADKDIKKVYGKYLKVK